MSTLLMQCVGLPFGEPRGELGEEGGPRLVRGAAVTVRAATRAARPRLTYGGSRGGGLVIVIICSQDKT